MARSALIGIFLLAGLTLGLCMEPDSGTAASVGVPDIAGAIVGANHAKPLPRVPASSDLLRLSIPAILVTVLAIQGAIWAGLVRIERRDPRPRAPWRSSSAARRGPPARVF
jgi:hypothetical protein